jgi:cation:H+ antiporter
MHSLDSYQLAIIALGAIAFGVYLLIKGGDWTIDGSVAVAEKIGLSKIFIAATIVAFGTSAPELFTSINANLSGFPGISVGNVVGSNVANILMVLAVAAMMAPIVIDPKRIRVDVIVMLLASCATVPAAYYGLLPRWGGGLMVVAIITYILYQYKSAKLDVDEVDGDSVEGNPFFLVTAGIATLLIGSEILVQGAVAGGIALGVPEAVIGMTMIAFGTSLPELTACVAAARRGESDFIIGGILGSNIFNILSVMAFSAAVKPLIIDDRFGTMDIPIMLGVTFALAFTLLIFGRIGRIAGAVMAVGYLGFLALQYSSSAGTLFANL